MTSAQLVPALVIPFVAWRLYARFRKNVGRQKLQPRRLVISIVLFTAIAALFIATGLSHPAVLIALAGGFAIGAPLAFFSLRLTKFEATADGKFYTPNTVIGVGLTLLFVGRIAYRTMGLLNNPPVQSTLQPQFFQSGLTMLILGVTISYYVAYYSGVYAQGRKLVIA